MSGITDPGVLSLQHKDIAPIKTTCVTGHGPLYSSSPWEQTPLNFPSGPSPHSLGALLAHTGRLLG